MKVKKVKIEVQHFQGCPNSEEMISRVKRAIEEINTKIVYKELLIETKEEAERVKFRGSPTVLINSIDLENMPQPIETNISCRFYKNGLPTIKQIKEFITIQLKNEEDI